MAWLLPIFMGGNPPEKMKSRLRTKGRMVKVKIRIGSQRLEAEVDLDKGEVVNLSLNGDRVQVSGSG